MDIQAVIVPFLLVMFCSVSSLYLGKWAKIRYSIRYFFIILFWIMYFLYLIILGHIK